MTAFLAALSSVQTDKPCCCARAIHSVIGRGSSGGFLPVESETDTASACNALYDHVTPGPTIGGSVCWPCCGALSRRHASRVCGHTGRHPAAKRPARPALRKCCSKTILTSILRAGHRMGDLSSIAAQVLRRAMIYLCCRFLGIESPFPLSRRHPMRILANSLPTADGSFMPRTSLVEKKYMLLLFQGQAGSGRSRPEAEIILDGVMTVLKFSISLLIIT